MCIFPYVSIEEVTDQDIVEKIAPAIKNLLPTLEKVTEEIKDSAMEINKSTELLNQWLKQHGASQVSGINPNIFSELDARFRKILESLTPDLSSDSAAYWGSRAMLSGFELSKKIPTSSFQVLAAR